MPLKSNDEVIAELDKTKFAKGGGACFECCDYEGMYDDLKSFLLRIRADDLQAFREMIEKAKVLLHIDENRGDNIGVLDERWGNGYNQALSDILHLPRCTYPDMLWM